MTSHIVDQLNENKKLRELNSQLFEENATLKQIIKKLHPVLPGLTPKEKVKLGELLDETSKS